MNTLNQTIKNVTPDFYLEEVSKDAALEKIKKACHENDIKFVPELIVFNSVLIHGGSQLKFMVDWTNDLEKELGVNYGKDCTKFAIALSCYNAATFKIDRKWFDQGIARCVKLFYTGGIEFLTSLKDNDPLSPNHYLSVSSQLDPLERSKQVEELYFN